MQGARRLAAWAALVGLLAAGSAMALPQAETSGSDGFPGVSSFLPGVGDLEPYRGDLHAHTGYSDGEQTPETAFREASGTGLDFFAITEHSEWFLFPFRADEDCIGPQGLDCYESPLPERNEWEEIGFQAQRFTDEGFLAMRGFEWSSPIEGHVNVYETRIWTDTVQTGPAPMTGLYAWLLGETLDPDRYATFNHPGREPVMFDQFAYDARVDEYIVGLESFNRDDDYTDTYLLALDRGWHVGTHGVTDGHDTEARMDPQAGHTVVLADELSEDGLRRAMVQHHTVATRGTDQDARLFVDGELMGDVVTQHDGTVDVTIQLKDASGDAFEAIELLGPQGWSQPVDVPAESHLSAEVEVDVTDLPTTNLGERYLTLRASQSYEGAVQPTVMTSAVWILG